MKRRNHANWQSLSILCKARVRYLIRSYKQTLNFFRILIELLNKNILEGALRFNLEVWMSSFKEVDLASSALLIFS